jgi:hypothetical protein
MYRCRERLGSENCQEILRIVLENPVRIRESKSGAKAMFPIAELVECPT